MRVGIALAGLAFAASVCFAGSPPKAAKSPYLRTTGAGFLLSKADGAMYAMSYEVRKPFPGQLFCVVIFDNPESPANPFRKEMVVAADAKDIQIESPGIHSIQNNVRYKVTLVLYLDAEHSRQFTQHQQEVLFSMPVELLGELREKFGLVVQQDGG